MKRQMVIKGLLTLVFMIFFANCALAKTVTLSWDASSSSVSGYKIYYKADSSSLPLNGSGAAEGASPISVGNVLTYTLTGLPDDKDHFFAVTAINALNEESSYSNFVESPIVSAGNNAPVLAAIGGKSVVEGALLSFTISATDTDSDPLTYSASNLPTGAGFNTATKTFSWSPGFSQSGTYSVTFTVSDGNLTDAETVSITVSDSTVGNLPPVLNSIGTKTIGEGSQLSFTINGSDPDNDAISFSAINLPAGASFNPATRSFVWIPDYDSGTNTRIYPVTFEISDGSLSDSETVTINVTNVNRAPVLSAVGNQNLMEGEILNLVVAATDPDGETVYYSADNLPNGAVFTPSTRSLSWIPDNSQAGNYSVTISASDGSLSDSETFTITIGNANEAPVLGVIGSQTVPENSLLSFVVSASDSENDSLAFSVANLPAGASFDAGQQRFSWTPDFTQAGNFTVTFSVSDGSLSDSEAVAITVVNTNQAPTISGTPATTIMASTAYSFTPTAVDLDGDNLSFNVNNKPAWASFDQTTGKLSGTPSDQQLGPSAAITIGVTDGTDSAVLSAFTVTVTDFVAQDSDGDGVLDNVDAFPNDNSEWLDSDGDLIGNNADLDDDNDGIADVRDGAPLDPNKSGWVISATAGTGGYITPEGETSVLYGGAQSYSLTTMAGYYINDLLVDGISVGITDSYQFSNVVAHHAIVAVFAPIPNGLSVSSVEAGLSGVSRLDNGDDSSNLVDGNPKNDLDYKFQVNLRDSVLADQRKVFLMLDGYRYDMALESGVLGTGAGYVYTTKLGPGFAHNFYFQAEDLSGNPVSRYPQGGTLSGPTIQLLNGKNVIGIPADVNSANLDSKTAFDVTQAYRWIPADKLNGSYEQVDRGPAAKAGEGYVLKRTLDSTLPSMDNYGEISEISYEIQVESGWNLIANPYKGNVRLAEVLVKSGSAVGSEAVPWLTAAANNLIIDGIYYYLGKDWGNSNGFASASGPKPAVLTPYIGYWIYVNPTAEPISLLIPKPQQ